MPRIPILKTTKNNQKVDTSLRDSSGNIRPEQKQAMSQLIGIGSKAAKPYSDTIRRIFKTSFSGTAKKSIMQNVTSHKKRLEEAMKGNF